MWSGLPKAKPPQLTEPGSALNRASRSPTDLIGESAATTSGWNSPVSRGYGRHLIQRHRRLVDRDRADEAQPRDEEARTARTFGHELRQADGAAGPRNVLDLHAGRQSLGQQDLLRRPGELVVAAAGTGRRDQLEAFDLGAAGTGRNKHRDGGAGKQEPARQGRPSGITPRLHEATPAPSGTARRWKSSAASAARTGLLHQPDGLERRLDLGLVLGQEGRELVGRLVEVDPAPLLERVLPSRAFHHLADRGRERLHLLLAQVRGREQAAPVDQGDVDPLLLQGRDVHSRNALVARDRQGAQLAGRDLRRKLLVAADAGGDMAAQDRRERLAAAGMGDV